MPQNVEALRVSLHHPVFDAVVDHLDEMPGAVRPGMEIALAGTRVAAFAVRASARSPLPRRERAENRVEPFDHLLLAADHQAIAALQPPDAAAGADVEIVDAALPQRGGAADVVLPERVAPVDDGVAGREQAFELRDRGLGHGARRQHQPDDPRRGQALHQVLQGGGGLRPLLTKRQTRLEIGVENHAFVPVPHQPPGDIRAHPPEADYSDPHRPALHPP